MRTLPIGEIITGDGSAEQFSARLMASPGKPLCLVGTGWRYCSVRPMPARISLLRSGTQVNTVQLVMAMEGAHVFCPQAGQPDGLWTAVLWSWPRAWASVPADSVRNWMRMPLYVYYNDLVADWHRLYRPILSMNSKCAVVDDDLNICGTLDTVAALSSTPLAKSVQSLYFGDRLLHGGRGHADGRAGGPYDNGGSSAAYITRAVRS